MKYLFSILLFCLSLQAQYTIKVQGVPEKKGADSSLGISADASTSGVVPTQYSYTQSFVSVVATITDAQGNPPPKTCPVSWIALSPVPGTGFHPHEIGGEKRPEMPIDPALTYTDGTGATHSVAIISRFAGYYPYEACTTSDCAVNVCDQGQIKVINTGLPGADGPTLTQLQQGLGMITTSIYTLTDGHANQNMAAMPLMQVKMANMGVAYNYITCGRGSCAAFTVARCGLPWLGELDDLNPVTFWDTGNPDGHGTEGNKCDIFMPTDPEKASILEGVIALIPGFTQPYCTYTTVSIIGTPALHVTC